MERDKAIELVDLIRGFDAVCDQIERFAGTMDDKDEAKSIIKGLGMVVGEIYLALEQPVYEKHPDLPIRLDQSEE